MMGKGSKGRKGQGTLEYVLVLLAVLLAVIAAAATSGPVQTAIGSLFTNIQTKITAAGTKIAQ